MSYRKALLEGLEVHGQMGLFGTEPLPAGFAHVQATVDYANQKSREAVPALGYDLIDVSLTAIEDSQYYEVGYQAEVKSGPRTGLLCTGSDYDNTLKVMAHKLGVSVDLLNVVEFG